MKRGMILNDYVIAFSSFYKAMYAQEVLMSNGIRCTLQRLPAGVIQSCGYALHVNGKTIHEAMDVLKRRNILWMGAYMVENVNGKANYRSIV